MYDVIIAQSMKTLSSTAAIDDYGGFPNDTRPVNIKLKRVSENINSNGVAVNIKLKRVSKNINSNRVSVNIKLKRVAENIRKY